MQRFASSTPSKKRSFDGDVIHLLHVFHGAQDYDPEE
jgi:hypothetical protein